MLAFEEQLGSKEISGDAIPGFAHQVYKVRIPSIDQQRGKRGGFRIVYFVMTREEEIYLLSIYAKAGNENIRKEELQVLVDQIVK